MNLPHLPLLPFVAGLFNGHPLANTAIVACQHLLGTQLNLLDELVALGLCPQDLFLIGKSYSTCAQVYEEFRRRGVEVSPASVHYNSHVSFDEQFDLAAEAFLADVSHRLRGRSYRRIIVVDVGGHLWSPAKRHLVALGIPLVGVEQTTSGLAYVRPWEQHFPLVDVARSRAKHDEAPLIAALAASKLASHFSDACPRPRRTLILGQGPIGRAMKLCLAQLGHDVHGYDINPGISDLTGALAAHVAHFEIVIGATGQTALRASAMARRREEMWLASISSSDREFAAVELRRHLPASQNPHMNPTWDGVQLLNSGFPINFDGSPESLAPHRAQLVVALMLAAICQAATLTPTRGRRALDVETETRILEEFNRISEHE